MKVVSRRGGVKSFETSPLVHPYEPTYCEGQLARIGLRESLVDEFHHPIWLNNACNKLILVIVVWQMHLA
jgi:hypothetical protein